MSSLTPADQLYFEQILRMRHGYVLDFTDARFAGFFKHHELDIHGETYQTYGKSKARKLRAFWEQEPDALVSRVLSEMLDIYEAECDLNGRERDVVSLAKCRQIVDRLSDEAPTTKQVTVQSFLLEEFNAPNIRSLPVEPLVAEIIEGRLKEASAALSAQAHLAVIFLCGSVLEGVLLGAAQLKPESFNRSQASPKWPDGKVKQFHEWSLREFIDVASDIGLLKPDVKQFSHGLRDFRNYIHPYQQMVSNFTPDEHTAKVCFQVLKAALASVAGDR